jgi:peptidoglycan/LPS O-acetylase OafA/YrhL
MNKVISKHIPIIDGMRAYAVLMVCQLHFFLIDESSLYKFNKFIGVILFKFSDFGHRGVDFFFIVSGFLITGILLDSKNSDKYFSAFYGRRFLRIFPLYYFVLGVSFLIVPHLIKVDSAANAVIKNQAWLWTYTSNFSRVVGFKAWDSGLTFPWFGHFWTLCVEEHFYIFWPLLVYYAGRKWLPRFMWIIVALSSSAVLFDFFTGNSIPIFQWATIPYAGVLSVGGLIAWYKKNPEKYEQLIYLSRRYILPATAILILIIFIPRQYRVYDILSFFSSIIFFSLLLVVAINKNKITDALFNHKVLYFIGKISYGIYVYHELLKPFFIVYVYKNLQKVMPDGIILLFTFTIISTAISIFIAWVSWIALESPILKLKKHFNYNRKTLVNPALEKASN